MAYITAEEMKRELEARVAAEVERLKRERAASNRNAQEENN